MALNYSSLWTVGWHRRPWTLVVMDWSHSIPTSSSLRSGRRPSSVRWRALQLRIRLGLSLFLSLQDGPLAGGRSSLPSSCNTSSLIKILVLHFTSHMSCACSGSLNADLWQRSSLHHAQSSDQYLLRLLSQCTPTNYPDISHRSCLNALLPLVYPKDLPGHSWPPQRPLTRLRCSK